MIETRRLTSYCKLISKRSAFDGPADFIWQHGSCDYDTAESLLRECKDFLWSFDREESLWMRGPITERRNILLDDLKDTLTRGFKMCKLERFGTGLKWILNCPVKTSSSAFHSFDMVLSDKYLQSPIVCVELGILAKDDPKITVQAMVDTCRFTDAAVSIYIRLDVCHDDKMRPFHEMTIYTVVKDKEGEPKVAQFSYPAKLAYIPTVIELPLMKIDMEEIYELLFTSLSGNKIP